jgi:hypothetical protein
MPNEILHGALAKIRNLYLFVRNKNSMKHSTLILLLLSFISSNSFCQTTPSKSKLFKDKKVSQITETEFTDYSDKPSITVKEFNSNGELIVETLKRWNTSDSIYMLTITTYEYDSLSNVTRIFKKENALNTLWFDKLELFYYSYDSNFRKVTVKEWSKNGASVHDTTIHNYKYDSKGNNTLISRYRLDGFLLDERSFVYDTLNRLIEKTWQVNSKGHTPIKTKFSYNDKTVLEVESESDGDLVRSNNLSYFNRKNQLKKITNKNGKLKRKCKYNSKGLPKKVTFPHFYRTFEYIYF